MPLRVSPIAILLAVMLASPACVGVAAARSAAAGAPGATGERVPLPPVQAVRLASPVTVDGVLDEAAWQGAPAVDAPHAERPDEGAAAQREHRGVGRLRRRGALRRRALRDSRPDSIIAHLVRRDVSTASDRFMVYAGPVPRPAQRLLLRRQRGRRALRRHALQRWLGRRLVGRRVGGPRPPRRGAAPGTAGSGWTCELRIPFSQTALPAPAAEQVWGDQLQARHRAPQRGATTLVYMPKQGSGFVSRFPHLVGIRNGHHARGARAAALPDGQGRVPGARRRRPVPRRLALHARHGRATCAAAWATT